MRGKQFDHASLNFLIQNKSFVNLFRKNRQTVKNEILDKIQQAVRKIEPEAVIILFGSRARREEREDSDWDILILIPGKSSLKKEQEFRHALFNLELEYGQAFSTFVYSKEDWETTYYITPLYQNIQEEGVYL